MPNPSKNNYWIFGNSRTIERQVLPNAVYYLDCAYVTIHTEVYYVILLVDSASGFLHSRLIKALSYNAITEFMLDITTSTGIFLCLIMDQGTENKNSLVKV